MSAARLTPGFTRGDRPIYAAQSSVFDDLVYPVYYARNVTAELEQKRPKDLEAEAVFNKDGKKRQDQAQED